MIYKKHCLFLFFLFFLKSSCYFKELLFFNEKTPVLDEFIAYAHDKGESVFVFDVFDFLDLSKKERINLSKIEFMDQRKKNIQKKVLKNNWSNNNMVVNFDNKSSFFLYPRYLLPDSFYKLNCSYLFLVSNVNDCLNTSIGVKIKIKEALRNNNIFINERYLSDFLYVHELAHLIPDSRLVPFFKGDSVWVENLSLQYGEIYSDLFSIMYLHNILNYDVFDVKSIILIRNFKLFSNDDLVHYSVPYVLNLLKDSNWMRLKSFKTMDEKIRFIYKKTNESMIISKKRFKSEKFKYRTFCKNFNFDFLSAEESSIINNYCKFSF